MLYFVKKFCSCIFGKQFVFCIFVWAYGYSSFCGRIHKIFSPCNLCWWVGWSVLWRVLWILQVLCEHKFSCFISFGDKLVCCLERRGFSAVIFISNAAYYVFCKQCHAVLLVSTFGCYPFWQMSLIAFSLRSNSDCYSFYKYAWKLQFSLTSVIAVLLQAYTFCNRVLSWVLFFSHAEECLYLCSLRANLYSFSAIILVDDFGCCIFLEDFVDCLISRKVWALYYFKQVWLLFWTGLLHFSGQWIDLFDTIYVDMFGRCIFLKISLVSVLYLNKLSFCTFCKQFRLLYLRWTNLVASRFFVNCGCCSCQTRLFVIPYVKAFGY